MPKLILSMDGLVLKEVELMKERTTIGRRPHNDIIIDNLAVSGEHAVLITILNDSFIEDLGSTNGTTVNGQPIKKHFLQPNDTVELGKYKLKFVADAKPGSDYGKIGIRSDAVSTGRSTSSGSHTASQSGSATASGGNVVTDPQTTRSRRRRRRRRNHASVSKRRTPAPTGRRRRPPHRRRGRPARRRAHRRARPRSRSSTVPTPARS